MQQQQYNTTTIKQSKMHETPAAGMLLRKKNNQKTPKKKNLNSKCLFNYQPRLLRYLAARPTLGPPGRPVVSPGRRRAPPSLPGLPKRPGISYIINNKIP